MKKQILSVAWTPIRDQSALQQCVEISEEWVQAAADLPARRIINHREKVVHGAYPHDCPDASDVFVTVENGRATKIQGDPAHPVTHGVLCSKVVKYLDRGYSPERVL